MTLFFPKRSPCIPHLTRTSPPSTAQTEVAKENNLLLYESEAFSKQVGKQVFPVLLSRNVLLKKYSALVLMK